MSRFALTFLLACVSTDALACEPPLVLEEHATIQRGGTLCTYTYVDDLESLSVGPANLHVGPNGALSTIVTQNIVFEDYCTVSEALLITDCAVTDAILVLGQPHPIDEVPSDTSLRFVEYLFEPHGALSRDFKDIDQIASTADAFDYVSIRQSDSRLMKYGSEIFRETKFNIWCGCSEYLDESPGAELYDAWMTSERTE